MEFTNDLITKLSLSPEQVTALVEEINNHEAEIKKAYDGKANTDAEAIIEGAGKATFEMTGINREKGEKWAEYISRVSPIYLTGKLESAKREMDTKKKELDEAIKTGKPDALLQKNYDEIKSRFDQLQAKEAEFDKIREGDYENKYNQLFESHVKTRETAAFSAVKPAFPDTVNPYEANHKWNEFIKGVKERYNIEVDDDGTGHAIDKTNKHKTFKLSDLVEKDKEITSLMTGRKVTGLGGSPDITLVDVKGVPFKVPENATAQQRNEAIREYLTKTLGLNKISPEYAAKFAEYNKLLLQKTA